MKLYSFKTFSSSRELEVWQRTEKPDIHQFLPTGREYPTLMVVYLVEELEAEK